MEKPLFMVMDRKQHLAMPKELKMPALFLYSVAHDTVLAFHSYSCCATKLQQLHHGLATNIGRGHVANTCHKYYACYR